MKYKPNKPVKEPVAPTMAAKIVSTVLITCIGALVIAATVKLIMKMFGWDL